MAVVVQHADTGFLGGGGDQGVGERHAVMSRRRLGKRAERPIAARWAETLTGISRGSESSASSARNSSTSRVL